MAQKQPQRATTSAIILTHARGLSRRAELYGCGTATRLCGDKRTFLNVEGLAAALFKVDDVVEALLEGVVVADDDELIEATHPANLLGEVATPLAIHVLCRLVEEGDVEAGQPTQQREPHGQRGAHLFAAAELGEGALVAIAAQDDLIVV